MTDEEIRLQALKLAMKLTTETAVHYSYVMNWAHQFEQYIKDGSR